MIEEPIFEGTLYNEKDGEGLRINKSSMMGLPFIARIDPDMFDEEGTMVRTKRYDFDDNDYVPPKANNNDAAVNSENNIIDDDTKTPSKQLPTKVATAAY